MTALRKTSRIVKEILEEYPQTRNSDSYLYLKVLEYVAVQIGVDLHKISVDSFLRNEIELFPGFETVRRTRQKIQQTCPWLGACEKVEEMRIVNEEKYRAYARSVSNA